MEMYVLIVTIICPQVDGQKISFCAASHKKQVSHCPLCITIAQFYQCYSVSQVQFVD